MEQTSRGKRPLTANGTANLTIIKSALYTFLHTVMSRLTHASINTASSIAFSPVVLKSLLSWKVTPSLFGHINYSRYSQTHLTKPLRQLHLQWKWRHVPALSYDLMYVHFYGSKQNTVPRRDVWHINARLTTHTMTQAQTLTLQPDRDSPGSHI